MKTYIGPWEVVLMERTTSNLRDRLLIRILFRLGCRVSEALGLTVEDIDLQSGLVTIQHLKTRLRLSCHGCGAALGRSHRFCPKCGVRVVAFLERASAYCKLNQLNPMVKVPDGFSRKYSSIYSSTEVDLIDLIRWAEAGLAGALQ